MRWNQGRSTVDSLIGSGEFERVPASPEAAEAEPARARRHVGSARQLLATDPEGAYTLAYDAARRALAAKGDDMALTDADFDKIARRVWALSGDDPLKGGTTKISRTSVCWSRPRMP